MLGPTTVAPITSAPSFIEDLVNLIIGKPSLVSLWRQTSSDTPVGTASRRTTDAKADLRSTKSKATDTLRT